MTPNQDRDPCEGPPRFVARRISYPRRYWTLWDSAYEKYEGEFVSLAAARKAAQRRNLETALGLVRDARCSSPIPHTPCVRTGDACRAPATELVARPDGGRVPVCERCARYSRRYLNCR